MSTSSSHWLYRVYGLAALLVSVIGADAPGAHELHSHSAGLNGETHTHELGVAITCPSPPYYSLNGNDHGDEWTLIKSAFTKAGHPAHALYLPLPDAINALNKGWIDAVWVCAGTQPATQETQYLSKPLLPRQFVAISLADRDITIGTLADLRDKKVAAHPEVIAVIGTPLQQIERDNPAFRSVSNHMLLALMLFTGQVDVLVSERSVFEYYRHKMPNSVHPEQPVACNIIFHAAYPRLVFTDRTLRDEFNAAWTVVRQQYVSQKPDTRSDTLRTDGLQQEEVEHR